MHDSYDTCYEMIYMELCLFIDFSVLNISVLYYILRLHGILLLSIDLFMRHDCHLFRKLFQQHKGSFAFCTGLRKDVTHVNEWRHELQ